MSSDASVPLWLLYDDEVETWRGSQPPHVRQWLSAQGFKGERHRVIAIPDTTGSLAGAVAGLGKRQGELCLWHSAAIADRLPAQRFRLEQSFSDAEATQLALGFAYAAYRFERYRSGKSECASFEAAPNADLAYVNRAVEALRMARDWINTPAADFGPQELSSAARQIAERHEGAVREWVGDELKAGNFPAIHAVGRASTFAPRLIEVKWTPKLVADRSKLPKIVLIGKGVCFDSGGLDIKPASGMLLMKKDMGGAAVTLALGHMLMASGLKAQLTLLVPAVENSISGNAFRPGDVLATRKGLTVEVGNTDAEGRLVLCDALALADADKPDLIVDFATLTGAARVALGPELPALFGNQETLVRELSEVAAREHDPLWPMPLWAAYEDELASKIADLNNVSSSAFAGAIFGALFLKRFVSESTPWMHIDLFAWNAKERPGRGVGAEPQALRAVYRFLINHYGVVES